MSQQGTPTSPQPAEELQRVWELALRTLVNKLSTVTMDSYVRSLMPLRLENNVFLLGAPNKYAMDWIQRKASEDIRDALAFHLNQTGLTLEFKVTGQEVAPRTARQKQDNSQMSFDFPDFQTILSNNEPFAPQSSPATPSRDTLPPVPTLPVAPRFRFDNFIACKSNQVAYEVCHRVAENPGRAYNPVYLYGGQGLGKTHLLNAIANTIGEFHPGLRVAYVSSEKFVTEFFTAIKNKTTETFIKQYRKVDVMLVEDVQFFDGKDHANGEFLHTFDALLNSQKQIVLSADRSPRDINRIDERLRSRMQGGMVADVGLPELSTRITFLQRLCMTNSATVPPDVIEYMADAVQSNLRTLEGAFTRLIVSCSVRNEPIRLESAQVVLAEYFIQKPLPSRISLPQVLQAVAEVTGVAVQEIMGRSRQQRVAHARFMAMALYHEFEPARTTHSIGQAFDNRDHTTVLNAFEQFQKLYTNSQEFRSNADSIRLRLNSH